MTTTASTHQTAASAALYCSPLTAGELVEVDVATGLARTFRALADPTRVRLVSLIAAAGPNGVCICDLTEPVKLSQPTVSHHMKQLVNAGLVTREQRGRWAYYAVVPDALPQLAAALNAIG